MGQHTQIWKSVFIMSLPAACTRPHDCNLRAQADRKQQQTIRFQIQCLSKRLAVQPSTRAKYFSSLTTHFCTGVFRGAQDENRRVWTLCFWFSLRGSFQTRGGSQMRPSGVRYIPLAKLPPQEHPTNYPHMGAVGVRFRVKQKQIQELVQVCIIP